MHGNAQISALTTAGDTLLESDLGALDSVTYKAKEFTPMLTTFKYYHMRLLMHCFQLDQMHKNISTRHKCDFLRSFLIYGFLRLSCQKTFFFSGKSRNERK